jgi:hypothetical protein
MTLSPETQKAGTAAASAARSQKAAERRALLEYLETAPLTSPEEIRSYLEVVLRATATGAIPNTAGAASASVASKLLGAHAISISAELKELRARHEECVRLHQHQTGVIRHRR